MGGWQAAKVRKKGPQRIELGLRCGIGGKPALEVALLRRRCVAVENSVHQSGEVGGCHL